MHEADSADTYSVNGVIYKIEELLGKGKGGYSYLAVLDDKKYVYIAMAVNSDGPKWHVLDYGKLKNKKACFKKMGRNMLYIVLGYDGKELIPISLPFMLYKSGKVEYMDNPETVGTVSMDLRRKYYESYNVVNMRSRILGGKSTR